MYLLSCQVGHNSYKIVLCCLVIFNTQDVRDDVGQKQRIEAATALLCALETRVKAAPQTFSQILDILRHFFLPQELVAQMKKQCATREAIGTQRPPARSTHHDAGQTTGTQIPPVQSTHLETGEESASHGPVTPPLQHQKSGATTSHEPPVSVLYETRGTTVTQKATDGITHGSLLPTIHPGMCMCMCVRICSWSKMTEFVIR